MSAPLFLVEALPTGSSYTLDGPEGHHAATVQRLRAGETLILADGRGGTAKVEVTAVGRGSVEVVVQARSYAEAADPWLVVAQGIAKGDRGELAVQAMTEIGVDEILPWAASRSVAQWRGDRGFRARDKWASTAREAAKQARRPWLPVVGGDPGCSTRQIAARLAEATSSRATGCGAAGSGASGSGAAGSGAAGKGVTAAFVLHEEATDRLTAVDLPTEGEIVLVVGPEGGIADSEVAAFVQAGAVPVRLGREVLRTSTAGMAALSVLATRLGRW